jgi:hypothetical protein
MCKEAMMEKLKITGKLYRCLRQNVTNTLFSVCFYLFCFQYVNGLPVFVNEPYNPKKEIKVNLFFNLKDINFLESLY